MANNTFVCYWISQKSENTLDKMPRYVDIAPLAFVNVKKDTDGYVLDFGTFTSVYPADVIKKWIKVVQSNGTKVLLSIQDDALGQMSPNDLPHFVANVAQNVQEWGVDGLDFDYEPTDGMGGVAKSFIPIVQALRKNLGSDLIFTAPVWSPWTEIGQDLKTLAGSLNYVFTMDYSGSAQDYDYIIQLCGEYAGYIGGWQKLVIGMNAYGPPSDPGFLTPLGDIPKYCKYTPAENGPKAGVMLYTWTYDVPKLFIPGQDDHGTGQPVGTYSTTVYKNLK